MRSRRDHIEGALAAAADARTVDEQRIADRLLQAESFFHQPPSVATTALRRTALNERGLDKVLAVMALEITLRQLCSR